MTKTVMLLLVWGVAYSVLGDLASPTQAEVTMTVRGGAVFTTLLLLVTAIMGGKLVSLASLPPLLGMLLVGMLLANVPVLKTVGRLDPSWSSVIRSTALAVILIRAGLGLDPDKLRKLSLMVFRLAFLPCLTESCVVAVASYFILGEIENGDAYMAQKLLLIFVRAALALGLHAGLRPLCCEPRRGGALPPLPPVSGTGCGQRSVKVIMLYSLS